jgi:hypothetical protein
VQINGLAVLIGCVRFIGDGFDPLTVYALK